MSYLTIAIPTYERSSYLDKCLGSLSKNSITDDIEILIINNNSSDNTEKIIDKYKKLFKIKYMKNDTNIGPDENFKKCIKEASSKYIWLFGDDDIFFKDSINKIVNIIKSIDDIGLIHLRAKNFSKDEELLNYKQKKFSYSIIESKDEFIKKIHTNITFISANIINRDTLFNYLKLEEIPNNNLGQVYWSIITILKNSNNIFVDSKIFGARQFNSGNYNLCEVFGKNFIDILYNINSKYNIENFIKILKKRLLIFYLPTNITRIKNSFSKVKYSNCFKILYPKFKYDIYFWIFTVPTIFLYRKVTLLMLNFVAKFLYKT